MALPDPDVARRIKAISSVFEVGSPEPDYGYVENLDDGRGFTVTQYGFCTYNTEVADVIALIARERARHAVEGLLAEAAAAGLGRQEAWRFRTRLEERREIFQGAGQILRCDGGQALSFACHHRGGVRWRDLAGRDCDLLRYARAARRRR